MSRFKVGDKVVINSTGETGIVDTVKLDENLKTTFYTVSATSFDKYYTFWESDLSTIDEKESATKYDEGKLRDSLVDVEFYEDLLRILEFGAKKYGDFNWKKGFDVSRLLDSLTRHSTAIKKGEYIDPESGISHSASLAANAMFLHYYTKNK